MTSLGALEQMLREQPRKPPLGQWQPALSGDIDIYIDKRGAWYHEGVLIQRQSLIKLFASILRREHDGHYYLVTPVEKWRIRVEDTPLLAVDMEIVAPGDAQTIVFRLNTDELVPLDAAHALRVDNADVEPHPVVELEHGLSARLTSALFYRLVDAAIDRAGEWGVYSAGRWLVLAKTDSQ